ncbi:MAG: hypothetical protein FWD54_06045 [Endomicrobia bacterium]|nr:hypothetical protein [Endomicrobiia bacterium]MCL2799816.1 hypothetical protein [Endomicrobiia bacterium]
MSKQELELVKIIKDWVEKSYGESEANNPSWHIKKLAKEISLQKRIYKRK